MKSFKFNLPLEVKLSKTGKSKFIINMDHYVKIYRYSRNNAKILYKESIADQLAECPVFEKPIMIEYKWFPKIDNRADMDNVTGVLKKFFQDALTESGIIKDDDKRTLIKNVELVGHVDEFNPRVEATITELSDEYVAEHSVDAQLARFHEQLMKEFADELLEDKEAMIKTDIFKEQLNIEGKMLKKQVKNAIELTYGHKYVSHKRLGKYIHIVIE